MPTKKAHEMSNQKRFPVKQKTTTSAVVFEAPGSCTFYLQKPATAWLKKGFQPNPSTSPTVHCDLVFHDLFDPKDPLGVWWDVEMEGDGLVGWGD